MSMRQDGRAFMSWSFLKTTRARQEWWDFGDRLTHMGHFDFLVPDNTGRLVGSIPAADLARVARWPHIVHLLTVRNDGILSRFQAIVENTGGAQDLFISELHRILDEYPFAAGVDIDLEKGPNDNPDGVVALAKRIYESIKSRPTQRYVHWDLPPMTGDRLPWWERWCDYRRMEPYFDTCVIMSYAFAWAGSAPGPISPMWWMEEIYDYAVTRIPKGKIFLGIPGFGFNWRIDRRPVGHRGSGGTFLAWLGWQQGDFTFHELQPRIPFAGFLDEDSQSPYLLLHIYDYQDGMDAVQVTSPIFRVSGQVGRVRRDYLITYEKNQQPEFIGQVVDRTGSDFNEISGAMPVGTGWITSRAPELLPIPPGSPPGTAPTREAEGLAIFSFSVPQSGEYDLAARVNLPWWNRQVLQLWLNGVPVQIGPFPDWYPLHRKTHWLIAGRFNLSAGSHTLEVRGEGSQYGIQFWGFRVCSRFSFSMTGGEASFTLTPRRFKAVGGALVMPEQFVLTSEVLQNAPEHAWIWYDDFRDNTLGFYTRLGDTWSIDTDPTRRVLIQSDPASLDAQAHLSYYRFGDLNIRARMQMTAGSGTMGIVFKAQGVNDLYLFLLRRSTQTAELWQRQAGIWVRLQPGVAQSVDLNVWYTLRVRTRGSELQCWVGTSRVFGMTASLPSLGGFGIHTSSAACECSLLDAGDPYVYVPQEALDVVLPDGLVQRWGRIERTGVTWIDPWEYFRFDGPGEEESTRQVSISLDFEYFHSTPLAAFDDDRSVIFRLRDRGLWLAQLFLGDERGFSIAHYSDAEHFDVLANLAKHRWGLKGVGLWALGHQDPLVFKIREGLI
ncbi:MAG: hypothetical protein KGZ50_09400 [Peptococcaceae bacterium]|nr:hypothetical protein [Peptococcaceae bacterium]